MPGRENAVLRQGCICAIAAVAVLVAAPVAHGAGLRAGVASVDASWHVGASAGQYASDGTFAGEHGLDPHAHSTRRSASYGIQSRLNVRALVVEGADGKRIALVKNDLYIPQDLLWRRTAQLLEQGSSGITRETLTMAVSHNHSSPYYSSTSWGVWAFQDVFDLRFYDYYSRRMAEAVERAAAALVPVRVGAAVTQFDKTHRHSYGPAIADDGTPAGYPHSDTDHQLTVIRFDDVSVPGRPRPLANLVNFALHPEFLDGNDLISADYLGPLERMVDRETRGLTIFTQGAVGTAEPERSTYHDVHERLEFSHRDYAQAEYGARLMADAIVGASRDVADPARAAVPFATDAPVDMLDRWYPGPFSHPYPGVSNCRTDHPGVPVVGLPDCERPPVGPAPFPIDPGVPAPDNVSFPSYAALQEDMNVHLQAFRIGEILFTACSCEQWKDQSENIRTRTDRVAGNEYLGFDWVAHGADVSHLPQDAVRRMRAQVLNPANGWNDPENAATAESEPSDPALIKGNFTHDDDAESARLGWSLTVPIGMTNDYNGYIASYREYQRGDHYRKALTGWGPHSMDYLATRLVTLGRLLRDPSHELPLDQSAELALQPKVDADLAANDARARTLGEAAAAVVPAYEAALPDDAEPAALEQPRDVERFAAAFFTWSGGSNYTDDPRVTVERRAGTRWLAEADMSGEVPVTLEFPQGVEVASFLGGGHQWRWTAHFEAFASAFDTGRAHLATPAGEYRFAVRGRRRAGGEVVPYELVSDSFRVRPWTGMTVEDLRVDPDGRPSFRTGPRSMRSLGALEAQIGPIDYPDSYASPARFVTVAWTGVRDPAAPDDPARIEWYCDTCSFRPWIDSGEAERAAFTFVAPDGARRSVAARLEGRRWTAVEALAPGERARVMAGAVRDRFGNYNGRGAG
jgi:hypothetical protein